MQSVSLTVAYLQRKWEAIAVAATGPSRHINADEKSTLPRINSETKIYRANVRRLLGTFQQKKKREIKKNKIIKKIGDKPERGKEKKNSQYIVFFFLGGKLTGAQSDASRCLQAGGGSPASRTPHTLQKTKMSFIL